MTRAEILNLAAALHNQKNGISHVTYFYDGEDEQDNQLSHIVTLSEVEFIQANDNYLSLRELEERGYKDLNICKEPGLLKHLYYKVIWWLRDHKFAKEQKEAIYGKA